MKRFLLTSLLCSFLYLANAQHFNIYPSDFVTDTVQAGETSVQNINIVPVDSQEVQVKWGVVHNTLDTGWSVSLCDYPACYFYIPDSGTMDVISVAQLEGGLTPFFQLLVTTNDVVAETELSLYFYDVSEPLLVDTITFSVVNTPAPIDTSEVSSIGSVDLTSAIKVFPNPANNFLTINGATVDDVSVFDLSGVRVKTYNFNGQQNVELSVADLASGMYILETRSGDQVSRHTWMKR